MPRFDDVVTAGAVAAKAATTAPRVARAAALAPAPATASAAAPAARPAAPAQARRTPPSAERAEARASVWGSAGREERLRMMAERAYGTEKGESLRREQELADLDPFIARLERVGELRKSHQVGKKEKHYYSAPGSETRFSPFPRPGAEYYSADFPVQGAGKGGAKGPTKMYAQNVISPTREELETPVVGARAAKNIADRYGEAARDYDRALAAVERQKQDPYASRADLGPLAADARAKLQRVADLRASLAEYGWRPEELSELER